MAGAVGASAAAPTAAEPARRSIRRSSMSMSVLHGWLGYEIDRSGSPDRDGERHIDIASDRIRVRADRMSTLDEPFGGLLVDACNGHGKRGSQDEASRVISAKVDPGDDVDILIGKAVAGVPAQMKESVLKAGRIPTGEELFGIGRIAPSAQGPWQRELEVEQTVFAADRTVAASGRRDFCRI